MTHDPARPSTFPQWLRQQARQRGDAPAVRHKRRGIWQTLSWSGWAGQAEDLAVALAALGLRRGDRMLFIGDQRPRQMAAMLAAQSLGAVLVPLHADSRAEEWRPALQQVRAGVAWAQDQEQVDKLLSLAADGLDIGTIIYDQERGLRGYRQPQLKAAADLLTQAGDATPAQREAVQEALSSGQGDDLAAVFFTAGTTAAPKAVQLTHAALIDRAEALARAADLTARDVVVAALPPAWLMQHLFGLALPLVTGLTVACPESSDSMLGDTREIGPTCFMAPPPVLKALLSEVTVRMAGAGPVSRWLYERALALGQRVEAQRRAGQPVTASDRLALALSGLLITGPLRDVLGLSRVRVAYAAGDAISDGLLGRFRALGVPLRPWYGSTETGGLVCLGPADVLPAGTVGRPVDGVSCRIDARGELCVRSPGLFTGYLQDADATRRTLDGQGWCLTGDAAFIDDQGFVHLIDRLDDLGAGELAQRVGPRLLEARLRACPYLKEAAVFPTERGGRVALLAIDPVTVGQWADARGLSYTGYTELSALPAVHQLIGEALHQLHAALAADPRWSAAQIQRFIVLPRPLDADDGVLTRTGVLRRQAVARRHRALLDALRADPAPASVGIDLAAAEDGAGPVRVELPVLQARRVPPAQTGAASAPGGVAQPQDNQEETA